jgi:hypothetical protein
MRSQQGKRPKQLILKFLGNDKILNSRPFPPFNLTKLLIYLNTENMELG